MTLMDMELTKMNWKNGGKRISLFLLFVLMATSGMILWEFVRFLMDVQELLDWMSTIEVR
jgi:hypothetical protein